MDTFDNESFGTKKKKKNYHPLRWFESFDKFDKYHASYGDDCQTKVLVLSDFKNSENKVKTINTSHIKWVFEPYIKFKDWKQVVKCYKPTNIVIDCKSATINEEIFNDLWENHYIKRLPDKRYGIQLIISFFLSVGNLFQYSLLMNYVSTTLHSGINVRSLLIFENF